MKLLRILFFILVTYVMAPPAVAQSQDTFVINLRDADVSVLVEQISEITGRTLVLDPNLAGDVTIVSAQALDQDGVWALFQSILKVRGFVAVQTGAIWQVVPEDEARTLSGPNEEAGLWVGNQDFVTQTLRLNRLPSQEAVRVLRPLVASSGYIEAIEDPNSIIITDTRANVERIIQIAQSFDGDAFVRSEVIGFRNADATGVGSAIVDLLGPAGTGARLSVNVEANLLLVRGTAADIREIRDLAEALDISRPQNPQEAARTRIFNLEFGDAVVVAEILRNSVGDATNITNPVAADVGTAQNAQEPSDDAAGFVALERAAVPPAPDAITITPSRETNAIIVRGTQAQIAEIADLIQALDVRRPQVMIEAAIVEVSGEVAERLGVQLGFGQNIPTGGIASTSFGNGGISLSNVLSAVGVEGVGAIPTGLSLGIGGNEFGVLI